MFKTEPYLRETSDIVALMVLGHQQSLHNVMESTNYYVRTALHEARLWRPFHVRLCSALAGIELLKDGGYCTIELDPEARHPARFRFHPLPGP